MSFSDVRAVVFDLDDTLYPEREYLRSGVRAVGAFLGEVYGEQGALRELFALEAQDAGRNIYSRWISVRGLDAAIWLPRLLHVHRGHVPALVLEQDVGELLRRLRPALRLGLVSDGRFEQQRAKAQALGLPELMDALVFSDELGGPESWKPHPAPFWAILERLQVSASEAVYVADNPAKDFLGARLAGMRSIRLRRADGLHATAEPKCAEAAPDAEIPVLSQLEELLSCRRSATL